MYLIPLYLGGLLCEATVIDHRYHLFYCIVKVMNRYSIAPRGPAKCHRVSFQFISLCYFSDTYMLEEIQVQNKYWYFTVNTRILLFGLNTGRKRESIDIGVYFTSQYLYLPLNNKYPYFTQLCKS